MKSPVTLREICIAWKRRSSPGSDVSSLCAYPDSLTADLALLLSSIVFCLTWLWFHPRRRLFERTTRARLPHVTPHVTHITCST